MTNGKGSRPRPLTVPASTYAENYERIFGNGALGARRTKTFDDLLDERAWDIYRSHKDGPDPFINVPRGTINKHDT